MKIPWYERLRLSLITDSIDSHDPRCQPREVTMEPQWTGNPAAHNACTEFVSRDEVQTWQRVALSKNVSRLETSPEGIMGWWWGWGCGGGGGVASTPWSSLVLPAMAHARSGFTGCRRMMKREASAAATIASSCSPWSVSPNSRRHRPLLHVKVEGTVARKYWLSVYCLKEGNKLAVDDSLNLAVTICLREHHCEFFFFSFNNNNNNIHNNNDPHHRQSPLLEQFLGAAQSALQEWWRWWSSFAL